MKLIVDPEAFLEVRNAAAFYEDSQPDLGKSSGIRYDGEKSKANFDATSFMGSPMA